MLSKRQQLQKDLEYALDDLATVLAADVQVLGRTRAVYKAMLGDIMDDDYTPGDLRNVAIVADLLESNSKVSSNTISEVVDEIEVIRTRIKNLRKNVRVDPPRPIGGQGAGSRPGEGLDWGVKETPTAADMDWIYEAGTWRSQRGLNDTQYPGDAYRQSRAAGVVNPHFGVVGRIEGDIIVGGKTQYYGGGELSYPGDTEASATFLGLTPDASARVSWGSHFQHAQPTGEVAVFDCGIQGMPDGHLMNAKKGARHCQIDGCWYVHHQADFDYTAGLANWQWPHSMSIGDTDVLIIRNHKWRGQQPTDPGLRFLYYGVAYVHGQRTSYLFENNDLRGGGRGAMQNRPDAYGYDGVTSDTLPTARVMLRGNYYAAGSSDFGDGGQCMGIWAALGGLFVYDNDCEAFPFTALMTSGQAPAQNWPNEPSGNQLTTVHMAGNRFVAGPLTRRAAINMSSIDELNIYDDNEVAGGVAFDAQWNHEKNGTRIGAIRVHAETVPEWMRGASHYDPARAKTVNYTDAELEAMLDRPAPF